MRHVLESDGIQESLSDIGNDVFYDLYSKNAEAITAFIQSEEKDDNSKMIFAGVATDFDTEDEAWKFYRNINDHFADIADSDERLTKELNYASDDKLECTATTVIGQREATTYSVYIDNNSVLILIGYECRTDRIDEYFDELCEIMEIPSPELPDIDLTTSIDEIEDRFMAAVDYLDAEEIEPRDLSARMAASATVDPVYFVTEDIDSSSFLTPSLSDDLEEGITEVRQLYMSPGRDLLTDLTMLAAYQGKDKVSAEELYDFFVESIEESDEADNIEYGEENGISYYKCDAMDYFYYRIYREDDVVYLYITSDRSVANTPEELARIVGLP